MKYKTQMTIKGRLNKKWEESFEEVSITYENDNTKISGNILDIANLHGILNLIRDLNLKITSVITSEEDLQ